MPTRVTHLPGLHEALCPPPPPLSTWGAWVVHQPRHELSFRDGSQLVLHPVSRQAASGQLDPLPRWRAVRCGAQGALVSLTIFDLADVLPALAVDLPRAPTRDVPGLVFFAFRGRFASAAAALEAIRAHDVAHWVFGADAAALVGSEAVA